MKWKGEPADFRVQERLRPGYLTGKGPWRVYKVTKRKLTSLEAAAALAELAAVPAGEVQMAGLKDRQGVTVQFMTLRGGRQVRLRTPELTIEPAGAARAPITSEDSEGNSFRIRLRELDAHDLKRIEAALPLVRAQGVPSYFDEQRFGNLRHGQGWIARELMLGRPEQALRALLCGSSFRDDDRTRRFKAALEEAWGDWPACRELAGRFAQHHSVFEHLRRRPDDFRGAFAHVATRIRLIHLFAFQSHVWNRAVARYLAALCEDRGAGVWEAIEGPLVFPLAPVELDPSMGGTFRLPGPGLEDVTHPVQRDLLEDVLAGEGLVPDAFRIEGVPGFALKGEDRALFVQPGNLRAKVPERPNAPPGRASALVSFDLPRGAYATLVVRGLFAVERKGALDIERLEEEHRARRAGGGERSRRGGRGARPERGDRRPRGRSSGGEARTDRRPRAEPDQRRPPSEREERAGRRGRSERGERDPRSDEAPPEGEVVRRRHRGSDDERAWREEPRPGVPRRKPDRPRGKPPRGHGGHGGPGDERRRG